MRQFYQGDHVLSTGLSKEAANADKSHYDERFSIDSEIIKDELKYHTSWEWLMPVVEKIREHTTVTINLLSFDKYPQDNKTMVTINSIGICITDKDSKLATYKAVVEFIKWYNERERKFNQKYSYGLSAYDIGLSLEVHDVLNVMAASDKLPLDMTQLDILDVFSKARESIEKREREKYENKPTKNEWAFQEGDNYFPIERMPEGGLHIALSCWDEQSEEEVCIKAFPTLREALNYIETELPDRKVTYSDFKASSPIEIIV
jgi:hypothetical protein